MDVLLKHEACTPEVATFENVFVNVCYVTTGKNNRGDRSSNIASQSQ